MKILFKTSLTSFYFVQIYYVICMAKNGSVPMNKNINLIFILVFHKKVETALTHFLTFTPSVL